MKPSIGIALLLSLLTACTATRPPLDEDAINSDAVQRHGWRPSGPPNPPVSWEDSIDAGYAQRRGYRPSGPPNPPVSWEDSIDAGRVGSRSSSSSGDSAHPDRASDVAVR
jgi:hypothetical protein